MVAFWPWRGDSSSTADFERTLSTLSAKITDSQTRLDKLRSSSRRAKVLWTLYLSFAYLVYTIVLLLVVGYRNLGAYEWSGLAGGSVLIYIARTTLATFYNFRIESLSTRLKEQQEERAKTIQKLKDATKYNSTMELIEKYGGEGGKPKGKKKGSADDSQTPTAPGAKQGPGHTPHARTQMPPPATANIPRRIETPNSLDPGAEFAPNADFIPAAFSHPPPIAQTPSSSYSAAISESHWYDRIFDVLLGEDETAAKNRFVLICQSCRLVNGQAPPGTKTLSELGAWKCLACGAMNGELDECKRIVNEVLSAQVAEAEEAAEKEKDEAGSSDAVEVSKEEVVKEMDDGPAAGVRKRKGKGKK